MARYVIDAGHGMSNRRKGVYDPGAVAYGRQEHIIAAGMARRLEKDLVALGHAVMVIDSGNVTERDDMAFQFRPDLAVSLHCNASVSKNATGVEVWVDPDASARGLKFAGIATVALSRALGLVNRGIKRTWFAWFRKNRHDALVELFFITNKRDLTKWDANVDAAELALLNSMLRSCGQHSVDSLPRKG